MVNKDYQYIHGWLVLCRDSLLALRRLPILTLTGLGVANFVDQDQRDTT